MKTLLVCAHPGHELRLHHWMERVRPDVFLITDGSGSSGAARLTSSLRVIDNVGGRLLPGSGSLSDQCLYSAMRSLDLAFFSGERKRIEELIRLEDYDEVVCDGLEGFNTAHDWCHYMVHSLAGVLGLRAFDHSLVDAPEAGSAANSRRISLDGDALARKLRAASEYTELAGEVQASLERLGTRAFSLEVLRPIVTCTRPPRPPGQPPYYETFGEQRVRDGAYAEVIRWESHLRPLVEGIWESAPNDSGKVLNGRTGRSTLESASG